ncbi:transposase, partial [Bradyrhizobium sp. NAS80.1]|uniref:transposase n=1 Tax=Bradyrhizobium sp. NAS80.1 TaxID=1680159 RepID=UPI0024BFB872
RVPAEYRTPRSKPEIALAEIDRVMAANVRFGCVLADAGYAKETMMRALAATRKRHAHLLAQKELDQQNADGAASPRDEAQTSPISKTGVRSQG